MQNKVELLGYYGGDKRHCLSAWQSTSEELGIKLPEKIEDRVDVIFDYIAKTKKKTPEELLFFLADNHHETPFEKSILDFQITGDLASHIHSLKHRISSINSASQRYKEFIEDKYYLPEEWKNIICNQDIFYGNSIFAQKGYSWYRILDDYSKLGFKLYHAAIVDIGATLKNRKRAKESARYFLGYNTQLNYDWQMNFRSFVNIQQLRNSHHAQEEIHYIANTMLYLIESIPGAPFKHSLAAFNLVSDPNYILE